MTGGEPRSVRADVEPSCDKIGSIMKQIDRLEIDAENHLGIGQTEKYQDDAKDKSADQSLGAKIDDFDHVTFWVGNAKQSASFYMMHFGFQPYAFRGLETGYRDSASHVLRLNQTLIQFVSPVKPNDKNIGDFLVSHGDAVKDVAFRVRNIQDVLKRAMNNGAKLVEDMKFENNPDGSWVKRATIRTFGDITHTFIERNYEYDREGRFLPGYQSPALQKPECLNSLEPIKILRADHIVGQFPPLELDSITDWYVRVLDFKRYWSVDEKQIYTDHSGVKSHVVSNHNERIKMPLCEVTLSSKAKSKAEEFVRFNNGSGIHHIALLTDDIVSVVSNLRARGLQFLNTPDTYYKQLRERLKNSLVEIDQDIERLRKLKILVDFDERGYLLQIFTRPLQDRPTLVIELIQRFNHDGFGAGNFLALFKAIEAETAIRGNL